MCVYKTLFIFKDGKFLKKIFLAIFSKIPSFCINIEIKYNETKNLASENRTNIPKYFLEFWESLDDTLVGVQIKKVFSP